MRARIAAFERQLTLRQKNVWSGLSTPFRIQEFLDSIPYTAEDRYRCPLNVLRDKKAHCFDGGIFAAAALAKLGHPPLLVFLTSRRDDEHLLTIYKRFRHWGAISKSNYAGLRFREPVYRTLRELVLSYFEPFFNIYGEKSLRGYTIPPLNLDSMVHINWLIHDEAIDVIADRLDRRRVVRLLTRGQAANLSPVDRRSYRAHLLGANRAGLYRD
jgi:hypothetical protein